MLARLLAVLLLATPAVADTPRLVLFITVDQLRGDMPDWILDRVPPGGFRLLYEQGVVYTDAHYRHSTTHTASGFATLFTGSNPREHGIVGNRWSDAEGKLVYSGGDDRYRVLGAEAGPHAGTSPRLLSGTMIGDELIEANGGRVFAVALKDRSAIFSAGRQGKGFWYTRHGGLMVTSSFYYDELPAWVTSFNAARPADAWRGKTWTLMADPSTYRHGDDRPFERAYGSLGQTFPHPIDDTERVSYYRTLLFTPAGDELILSFVKTLMAHERIGAGPQTDLLAVALQSPDYVGHAFGPHSREAEDNLLRLDRILSRLFEHVDETVGLDRTLIVLSSDHGVANAPERTCGVDELITDAHGCDASGRFFPKQIIEHANEQLRTRFDVDADLVIAFFNPGLYLDERVVESAGLDLDAVELALAEIIAAMPGVAHAIPRTDVVNGRLPDTVVMERIRRGFHPGRSGHVQIVQEPNWYLYDHPLLFSGVHGSPYDYDTHVPIIFTGPGIEPATVKRRVGPEDVAPTLAAYLGIPAPSLSTGDVLPEIVELRRQDSNLRPSD